MTDNLKLLLKYLVDFDNIELAGLEQFFHPKMVKKGHLLLRSGDVCRDFYFVNKGCLRTYFIDKAGHEKTRLVLPDFTIGTSFTSFIHQIPSFEFVDALEDSELLQINRTHFYTLVNSSDHWKSFYIRILEMAYAFQNNKIEELTTLSAKQRYEKLRLEKPALIQKLSNKVLASYLDIREETLSRLKSG